MRAAESRLSRVVQSDCHTVLLPPRRLCRLAPDVQQILDDNNVQVGCD